MLKIVTVMLFALSFFILADEKFTLDEYKRIDKYVKAKAAKKFNEKKLKQVEKDAAEKYRLYKVGDTFSASARGKHYKGKIYKINRDTIQVGSDDFTKKDYPTFYFDKDINERARTIYFQKHFRDARRDYIKLAEAYCQQKILDTREPLQEPLRNQYVATDKEVAELNKLPLRPVLDSQNKLIEVKEPYKLFETIGSGAWTDEKKEGQFIFRRINGQKSIDLKHISWVKKNEVINYKLTINETVRMSKGTVFKCFVNGQDFQMIFYFNKNILLIGIPTVIGNDKIKLIKEPELTPAQIKAKQLAEKQKILAEKALKAKQLAEENKIITIRRVETDLSSYDFKRFTVKGTIVVSGHFNYSFGGLRISYFAFTIHQKIGIASFRAHVYMKKTDPRAIELRELILKEGQIDGKFKIKPRQTEKYCTSIYADLVSYERDK